MKPLLLSTAALSDAGFLWLAAASPDHRAMAVRTEHCTAWMRLERARRWRANWPVTVCAVASVAVPTAMLVATDLVQIVRRDRRTLSGVSACAAETRAGGSRQGRIGGDCIEGLARKFEERRQTPLPYSRVVADAISDCSNGDVRRVDGIRKTGHGLSAGLHNPRIADATSAHDLDVRNLRQMEMTEAPPGDIPRLATLSRLSSDQLLNLGTVKPPQQDPTPPVQMLSLIGDFARRRMSTPSSNHAALWSW